MKFVKVILAIYCYATVEACFQQQWRGHKVICCPNGTAIETTTGQKIWVVQKSEVCDATGYVKNSKVANWVLFTIIGTLSGCCCWWKFPFKKVWRTVSKCCATEAQAEEQPEAIEVKVIKATPAKLPRSQSV